MKPLVAIGAAFLDIVVRCSSPDLSGYGKELNETRFLTKDQFLCVKKQMKNPLIIPGGSAANATAIFAKLGGKAFFGTTIGTDIEGKIWTESLQKLGVDTNPYVCTSEPTGGCLVFVHPDGQRSMRSYPGTEKVAENNLHSIPITNESIVFLEGYGLKGRDKAAVYVKALERAKDEGAYIVLNASDPVCVKEQRQLFSTLIENTADLIIMNEEEACELVQGTLEDCIEFIKSIKKCAVITLGPTGAIAIFGGNVWHCTTRDVKVIDTLGAGDGFAGGFLYGLACGWSLPECLRLGNYIAAEIVSRIGGRVEENLTHIVAQKKYQQLLAIQLEHA